MTEKEQIILEKIEKHFYEQGCSSDMLVSTLKLVLDYNNGGSPKHLSQIHNVTPQYITRVSKKIIVNGVKIYQKVL